MSSYFPLLPNITLDQSCEKILGSITFLNYPNNIQKQNRDRVHKDNIYIGIYILDDYLWKLVKSEKVAYKNFLEVNRTKLSVADDVMAVAIIRKQNDFALYCENLPMPNSLRVDKALVSERASYNFSYKSLKSSYQGEYPVQMSMLNKASFFSFDSLKASSLSNNVSNFLLLINLKSSAKCQNSIGVKMYDPLGKSLNLELKARENLVSVYELSKLYDPIYLDKTIFLGSNELAFIPLILSIDKESNQLALEHTHPPGEMFWGIDKAKAVKLIKAKWAI